MGSPMPNGFCGRKETLKQNPLFRAQELCESGGGRPGFPVPNSPCGLCGRKAALTELNGGRSAGQVVFCRVSRRQVRSTVCGHA